MATSILATAMIRKNRGMEVFATPNSKAPARADMTIKSAFNILLSRLQKVNFSVRGQANVRCDGCNYLKSLVVRLSPLAVKYEFRLFAGDSLLAAITLPLICGFVFIWIKAFRGTM